MRYSRCSGAQWYASRPDVDWRTPPPADWGRFVPPVSPGACAPPMDTLGSSRPFAVDPVVSARPPSAPDMAGRWPTVGWADWGRVL